MTWPQFYLSHTSYVWVLQWAVCSPPCVMSCLSASIVLELERGDPWKSASFRTPLFSPTPCSTGFFQLRPKQASLLSWRLAVNLPFALFPSPSILKPTIQLQQRLQQRSHHWPLVPCLHVWRPTEHTSSSPSPSPVLANCHQCTSWIVCILLCSSADAGVVEVPCENQCQQHEDSSSCLKTGLSSTPLWTRCLCTADTCTTHLAQP